MLVGGGSALLHVVGLGLPLCICIDLVCSFPLPSMKQGLTLKLRAVFLCSVKRILAIGEESCAWRPCSLLPWCWLSRRKFPPWGWLLTFPHCTAANALLVSELKQRLRNSFLAMKNMGTKLIFLFLKYSLSKSFVKRMRENTHGTGEGLYRGVRVEVRQAFCRVHCVLLSLHGCGIEIRPPSLLSINLLSTKPSGCPHHFHFHMLDK